MLAGGMTIAAPSMMVPEAQAAGALYVSAENAMFNNTFGGAQIVEVVVLGVGEQTKTEKAAPEPTVKVDEHLLRMAQGADGNWYGYFGDSTAVVPADGTDNNLDFGIDEDPTGLDVGEASNVFINATQGVIKNAPILSNWNNTINEQSGASNVAASSYSMGQIGIQTENDGAKGNDQEWPMIQLYDFTTGVFDVVYEQAGTNERVTLDYNSGDLDDYASLVLDRNSASQESQVHLTITDNQLNIDPTAEDIVIFYIETSSEGVSFTNSSGHQAKDYKAWSNSFDDNGKLIINNNTNSATIAVFNSTASLDDVDADNHLVFWESAENSGIFSNTDDADASNLYVHPDAFRGTSATLDYNDSAQSFVVANDFGVIDMVESSVGDEWNSGEALTVTLIDQDLNKNTASDEDLVIVNTTNTHLIPSLQIGSPLTLTDASSADIIQVSNFSKIAYYTNATAGQYTGTEAKPYIIATGYTGTQLDAMDTENTYFSWNVASLENSTASDATDRIKAVCLSTDDQKDVVCGSNESGITEIIASGVTIAGTGDLWLNITKNAAYGSLHAYTAAPIVADVMSWGPGVNNAIYRILLEESGDNTATFEGTVEYHMLNQLNINSDATYTDLYTIDSDIDIIVEQDMTDEDSPRINYLDLGADGVSTQIADQVEAPTHNGVVSFDSENYKIADTVVVTLNDQDMNAAANKSVARLVQFLMSRIRSRESTRLRFLPRAWKDLSPSLRIF
jgi:hypothetical protein